MSATRLVFALSVVVASARAATAVEAADAYLRRGDRVEAGYRDYAERLDRLYASLSERVASVGSDLVAKLEAVRTQRIVHGYQVLPKLVPDMAAPRERLRARSISYSWPLTEQLIERANETIRAIEAELDRVENLSANAAGDAWEKLVIGYGLLNDRQRTIYSLVQYNRLWQAEIAGNRAGYDRMTALHDVALERQAILDALSAADEGRAELLEREKVIARNIQEAIDANPPPPFLRVEHPDAHLWVIHVPFYTDIADAEFVRRVKDSIEEIWHLRDGVDEFRVELPVTALPAARLYGELRAPEKGEPIDAGKHVALFPGDGAALTTGAILTHVFGRAIILGPHDIAPRVLAHEFGHILGFKDVYFRGYKDLGDDGFQVMEVIADPDDIMGAPGIGPVLRRHFERIIESLNGR